MMLMKMLADMAGLTPDELAKEIQNFQAIAQNTQEALLRIEKNTQENGDMLRLLLKNEGIEYDGRVDNDGGDPDHPRLPGT